METPALEKSFSSQSKSVTDGIIESKERGLVVLSPARQKPFRRIIYVNSYGGASVWEKIKKGDLPPHHLIGCLQLARMGYEVALAEPLRDLWMVRRRPDAHDLKLLNMVWHWLGRDGLVFCGHNLLFGLLLLKKLGLVRCRIVTNLWAREPLAFASAHSAILGLTGAGVEQAKKLAPKVKVAPLGWGADLSVYPRLSYRPEVFFSCGIACRDFKTLSRAAAQCRRPIEVLCPGMQDDLTWSPNVKVIDSGRGWNFENKRISYHEILHNYYARTTASLLVLKNDPGELTAVGFTEILEVMAMARPIIMTRTGALPSEIDVEKAGCGLFVPPENPEALAQAMDALANDPKRAAAMGQKGREMSERYYNIERYARDLHSLFQSL